MKIATYLIAFLLLPSIATSQVSDTLVWLKNNSGIIEDGSGAVIRWENAIMSTTGDAAQPDPTLAGEQRQETYPGKVNVGFANDGAFMTMEGSNAYSSDNSFTAFYTGKVGDVGSVAVMFGNFRVDNSNWGTCSGFRFTRKGNGNMTIQYGRPNYKEFVLNNLPEDEFFFFGFSVDASGNYLYFDNSSSIIQTGVLDGSIFQNTDDHLINLARQATSNETFFQTEIAELMMFGEVFTMSEMEQALTEMSARYPEIVKSEFGVTDVFPEDRTHLGIAENLRVTFNQNVDITSTLPKVYINKSTTEAPGSWTLTASNELTFDYGVDWPYGALVTVEMDDNLKSTDNVGLGVASRSEYNLIVESATTFGVDTIILSPMATVDFPQTGHQLPLFLVIPEDRTEKVPVHIWVHGGGWSGGSLAASVASYSPHGTYLAENLGVATLGISYRCQGSNGSFTLAMEDVDAAYQWAVANATTYNFDMTKVFFSGGSAGSPLAALAAQRYSGAVGFIGFNGMYDFVNDNGSFGQGNGYGQETPSATANSAIFNLRVNPPAVMMMHGDADNTIPYTQSTLFADAVNNAGGNAETVIYPGEVHAFFNLAQQEYQDVLYEMANFVADVLDGTISTPEPRIARSFVSLSGDDISGDGTEVNPYATLSKAYTAAVSGDTIFIEAGTYTYTGGGSLLNISKTIMLIGEGADVTILQNGTQPVYTSGVTQGRFALMSTANQSLTIEGLTIRNCGWYGSANGGGTINITAGSGQSVFTARRCKIEGGTARFGGAIQVTGAGQNKVILEDCSFTNNYAMPQINSGAYPQLGNYASGAIHASSNGSFEVYNCVFYDNGTLDNPLSIAVPGNSINGRVITANSGQSDAYGIITNSIFIDNVAVGADLTTVASAIRHLIPAAPFKFINNILVDNFASGSTAGVDISLTATMSDGGFYDDFKSNLIGKVDVDAGVSLNASNSINPSFTKASTEVLIDGGATPNIVINSFGVETISASGSLVLGTGQVGDDIKLNDINGNARGANVDLGAIQTSDAVATFTLSQLAQTYDGATKAIAVSTYPYDLSTLITYDGSTDAPTSAGTYSVLVTIDDTDANYTGESTTGTLEISKASQSITFPQIAIQNILDNSTYELVATGESGVAVQFSSSDPTIASVSGSTVTLIAPGIVTITASLAASANYQAATSVDRDLEVMELYRWDGANWNSPQAPADSKHIAFEGDFTVTEDMITASVDIKESVIVTIASGVSLQDQESISNAGTLIIKSGGSLVTLGNITGTDYQIERITTFDSTTGKYSAVGSPVESTGFDALGSKAVIYAYDETEPYEPNSTLGLERFKTPTELSLPTMEPGIGYFSASTGDSEGKVIFIGRPNTGEMTVALSYTSQIASEEIDYEGYNLLSNPYPSAITYTGFIAENTSASISESLYIWDDSSSDIERGSNADYLIINSMGNTDSRNDGELKWDGMIRSGQGFFVKATASTSIKFDNAMRTTTNNSDEGFFRQSASLSSYKLRLTGHRIARATVIGFANDASADMDDAYDAIRLGEDETSFYSLLAGTDKPLGIQGLPTDYPSGVALGFRAEEEGTYTISLVETASESSGKKTILFDKVNGKYTDLAFESYVFQSSAGTFNERFIMNRNSVLEANDSQPSRIYTSGKTLFYSMQDLLVDELVIFDVSGQKMLTLTDLKGAGRVQLSGLPAGIYVIKSTLGSHRVILSEK